MKMGPPINSSRLQAQFAGQKKYHGRPCKNCGTTEKYVENYLCVMCARDKARNRARRLKQERTA